MRPEPYRDAPTIARRAACVICALFDLAPETMWRKTRGTADEAFARQVLAYVLHVSCGLSLQSVARALGRDRSTIGHAVQTIEALRIDTGADAMLRETEDLLGRVGAIGATLGDLLDARAEADTEDDFARSAPSRRRPTVEPDEIAAPSRKEKTAAA